jgi:hypothetical protein
MTEIKDVVLEQSTRWGEPPTVPEFVAVAERAHPGAPGIGRDHLLTYAEVLEGDRGVPFDLETFEGRLDDQTTDSTEWTDESSVYAVGDDRVSRYPAEWHDALGGSDDPAAYLEFLTERDLPMVVTHEGDEVGPSVPQPDLLEILMAVGNNSRDEAREALQKARADGRVVEDADQHPNAGVYLPPDTGDMDGSPANPN